MEILISLVLVCSLIGLALWFAFIFVRGTYRFFRDFFIRDPEWDRQMEDIINFGNWKFRNGIWGHQSPEMDRKLRKIYRND